MNDNNIIEKFKICGITKSKIDKLSIKELQYLSNRFNDSLSIKESIFRILVGNLECKPLCPECGKPVKIRYRKNNPLYKTCGNKECILKRKSHGPEEANILKYGVKNQFQRPEIIEQIKQQNIEKYGVDHYSKTEEWKIKNQNTLLEKYGVKNQFQRPEIIEQIKQQNIEKYGVDHYSKTEEYKSKMSKIASSKEFQNKRNNTLLRNNTWNKSKQEEYCFNKLKTKFKNIIRQYKSKEYPFKCDFYIPEIKLYIEYNGSDLHNGRPFIGDDKDLLELNLFKEKSNKIKEITGKTKTRYDSRIETWTIRDINKRQMAKTNNLNWIEFFNLNEFNLWFDNF